jgi:uncharacterized membrane protein
VRRRNPAAPALRLSNVDLQQRQATSPFRGLSVPDLDALAPVLPIHSEETIQSIARLHAEHRANATRHQLAVDRITSIFGRPVFIAALTAVVISWMSLNGLAETLDYRPFDPPPFAWLSGATSLASLYLVVLILTTQSRDNRLTQRREQLTLELAILSEQKTAKVVALLEELRRDSPAVRDRVDKQADVMARPSDPQSVIDAIEETRSGTAHASQPANSA